MDQEPRGPGYSYIALLVVSILVAWTFMRPLGLQIRDFLQSVVDMFNNH